MRDADLISFTGEGIGLGMILGSISGTIYYFIVFLVPSIFTLWFALCGLMCGVFLGGINGFVLGFVSRFLSVYNVDNRFYRYLLLIISIAITAPTMGFITNTTLQTFSVTPNSDFTNLLVLSMGLSGLSAAIGSHFLANWYLNIDIDLI